jgi:6-phosphogluconolactonase
MTCPITPVVLNDSWLGARATMNDLGLDEILIYKMDPAKALLMPNTPPLGKVPPGTGPRHLAFAPNGKFAYVVNEMGQSTTAFSWDAAR